MVIDNYEFQKKTNLKEHNDIVNKLNEVIDVVNTGSSIDVYTKTETDALLNQKQNTLISGNNIKTINNISILGAGNIEIQTGSGKTPITTIGQIALLEIGDIFIGNIYLTTSSDAISICGIVTSTGAGIRIVGCVVSTGQTSPEITFEPSDVDPSNIIAYKL